MSAISVRFSYITGVKKDIFTSATLSGSWNGGMYSNVWSQAAMTKIIGEDGCPQFIATVEFDDSQIGKEFQWGVTVDGVAGSSVWGIPTEIKDVVRTDRYRTFTLQTAVEGQPQTVEYYLSHCRRLGANTRVVQDVSDKGIQFSVWAPNAQNVEVVFGIQDIGYISDKGYKLDPNLPVIPMTLKNGDGVWESAIVPDFAKYDHKPYMFRVTKKEGAVAYRTDLYSRCQIGSGQFDPSGKAYSGRRECLDGSKSCSVVVNPETVTKNFSEPAWPETQFIPEEEFWQDEFKSGRIPPKRVEDMVIYELHVGALGFDKSEPGDLMDAINILDYLVDLGVNAIELLPMAEYEGWASWGYGTSHYFAIEFVSGGRDQFKFFVRECHQRGIAVILDVVYNHYSPNAERAEWFYDADNHPDNMYYWYQGQPSDYKNDNPTGHGGYLDNMSTGYDPRFREEMVRKMFISSAVALVDNFHVDGFRLDQTTSIHSYNVLHADGSAATDANAFGCKFLREFCRTLLMVKPDAVLMAEDHSGWDMVTTPTDNGGLGFHAAWYADFCHHIVGSTEYGSNYAKLVLQAGYGGNDALLMSYFSGSLGDSGGCKVVYHASHDEVGNAKNSARTIVLAANHAPLIGDTRRYAEARCRFAFGMTALSAGTPMLFMGEEVGAAKDYKYDTFLENREDLVGERNGDGKYMFKFYQDIIRFRLDNSAIRARNIDVLYTNDANRIIAFRRWDGTDEFIVVASLNNRPFDNGYYVSSSRIADGQWSQVFNSDADIYGGNNIGVGAGSINSSNGAINVVIPANGFVVLRKGN